MSSHLHKAIAVASAIALAAAQSTNPNAEGACSPTQGGADACGPNGSEAWLNSGLAGENGWEPPFLDINGLSHISLEDYYAGVGARCQQYDAAFRASGDKYGIDPAILAFIAMQESSCNADEGGPTPGLVSFERFLSLFLFFFFFFFSFPCLLFLLFVGVVGIIRRSYGLGSHVRSSLKTIEGSRKQRI